MKSKNCVFYDYKSLELYTRKEKCKIIFAGKFVLVKRVDISRCSCSQNVRYVRIKVFRKRYNELIKAFQNTFFRGNSPEE